MSIENTFQDMDLCRSLRQLGFFVTEECPVLWRSTDEGGYALLVYLSGESGRHILSRLANSSDSHRLIEQALLGQPFDPPVISR
jgi:hypothetical protein